MPKGIERRLKKQATKKGLRANSDRFDRIVYGTLNKIKKDKDEKRGVNKRKKRKTEAKKRKSPRKKSPRPY